MQYTQEFSQLHGSMSITLDLLSYSAILSGILVIITLNPVISILFLIALFVNIAGYLILIGIHFLGLVYVLVYVGAIAVLFLFIIMLLNIKLSELDNKNSNGLPLGALFGILFLYPIYEMIPSSFNKLPEFGYRLFQPFHNMLIDKPIHQQGYQNDFTVVYKQDWDMNLLPYNHITSIGNILYQNYSIWLLITSLILLLSMMGSIILSLNPRSS